VRLRKNQIGLTDLADHLALSPCLEKPYRTLVPTIKGIIGRSDQTKPKDLILFYY